MVDYFITNIKLAYPKILLLTNERCTMKISRMNPLRGESKTAASSDIQTEEGIIIKGIRLVNGSNGMFLASPDEKGKDGKFYDTVIVPKEMQTELDQTAIEEYSRIKG